MIIKVPHRKPDGTWGWVLHLTPDHGRTDDQILDDEYQKDWSEYWQEQGVPPEDGVAPLHIASGRKRG